MKIVYFVTCMKGNTGVGGHYHSLKAIAETLSSDVEVQIIIIGDQPCATLENTDIICKRFNVSYNLVGCINSIYKYLKKEGVDVIHSFDIKAEFFARTVSNLLNVPRINTKCGGASPKVYYPLVKNLVLFSKEDNKYFTENKRFKLSNIFLIPNRVRYLESDVNRINSIKEMITDDRIIFLRIARIGSYYISSLKQSILLQRDLESKGYPTTLLIIGKVVEESVLEDLKSFAAHTNVLFLNDDFYTTNASALVNVAEYVIGTGRSFMEACFYGKKMLSPLKGGKFPVLVNKNNFSELFHYNFSERAILKKYSDQENLAAIERSLNDQDYSDKLKKESRNYFEDYFSIEAKRKEYLSIYKGLEYHSDSKIDYVKHFLFFVKYFVKVLKYG